MITAPNLDKRWKGVVIITKKYINYYKSEVYALYYRSNKSIYYNMNFIGTTQLILMI